MNAAQILVTTIRFVVEMIWSVLMEFAVYLTNKELMVAVVISALFVTILAAQLVSCVQKLAAVIKTITAIASAVIQKPVKVAQMEYAAQKVIAV